MNPNEAIKNVAIILIIVIFVFLMSLMVYTLFFSKRVRRMRAQLKEYQTDYACGKIALHVSVEDFRMRYKHQICGNKKRMFVGSIQEDDTFEFWYEIRVGFLFTPVWTTLKGKIVEEEILFEIEYYNADPPVDYERLVGKLKELSGDKSPLYSEAESLPDGAAIKKGGGYSWPGRFRI